MKKAKSIYLIHITIRIFFCCAYFLAFSQERPPEPLSPNAASLTQNINVPINEYTGQVNYNVPLHNVVLNDFELPVSLNYNYSGLKVESYASDVGLGWSLVLTGVINREVRGIPDEDSKGYKNSTGSRISAYSQGVMNASDQEQLKIDLSTGGYDPEMDIFHFNVPGHSGQFFFKHNETVATVTPESKLIVTATFNSSVNDGKGEIQNFRIVDQVGNRYDFMTPESAYEASGDDDFEGGVLSHNATTWYLDRITTKNGNIFQFSYSERLVALPPTISEERFFHTDVAMASSIGIPNSFNYKEVRKTIYEKVLEHVSVRNAENQLLQTIQIQYDDVRLDWKVKENVGTETKPKKVGEIRIIDGVTGRLFQGFEFDQSYFGDEDRLRLDRILRFDEENVALDQPPILTKEPFLRFDYYENTSYPEMGNRDHLFQQDYWGYYNGEQDNNTLIPDTKYFSGANRLSKFHTARAGALEKIIYPTGGFTKISYESHDVSADNSIAELVDLCTQEKLVWHEGIYADADNQRYQFILEEPSCIGVDYILNRVCGDAAWITISGILAGETSPITYYHDILPVDGRNAVTDSKTDSWSEILLPGSYSITMWSLAEAPSCDDPSVEIIVYGPLNDQMDHRTVSFDESDRPKIFEFCTSNGPVEVFFSVPTAYTLIGKLNFKLSSEDNIRTSVTVYKFDEGTESYAAIKQYEHSSLTYAEEVSNDGPLFLLLFPGGDYKLEVNVDHANADDSDTQHAEASLLLPHIFSSQGNYGNIGGIRVKRIDHCDGSGGCTTTEYKYRSFNDENKSSGILLERPGFSDLLTTVYSSGFGNPPAMGFTDAIRYRNRSTAALSSSHGSHIVYPEVTIEHVTSDDRYSTKKSFVNASESLNSTFPHPPKHNKDFYSGRLKKEQIWNSTKSCEKVGLVKETIDQSMLVSSLYYSGIKIDQKSYYHNLLASDIDLTYEFVSYSSLYGTVLDKGNRTEEYFIQNQSNVASVATEEILSYENPEHQLVTKRETINSNGDRITHHYRYPQDGYLDGSAENGSDNTRVIEQYSTVDKSGTTIPLSFSQVQYSNFGGKRRLEYIRQARSSTNNYEDAYQALRYDGVGNMLEGVDRDGVKQTYIWGYNQSRLIGSIKNAGYDAVAAYIGETTLLQLNANPADALIISTFEDLRGYFSEAEIVSYTYDPLVGMTSATDPNGLSTTYEYDEFNRLKLVKNDRAEILQKIDYHYTTSTQ